MSSEAQTERWIEQVTLEGNLVRLVPMRVDHAGPLAEIGLHSEIWRWFPWTMETEADFEYCIRNEVSWGETGFGQAFVTELRDTGEVIGSTTYLNADQFNRKIEIGATWLTPAWQRTGVNTECKWLLMRHAFEQLGANRVEFKTDSENVRSRAAIARIGAIEEGTLRNHMVRPDGTLRHSVYFSVTVQEWPGVEEHLRGLMRAYGTRLPVGS